ncbi:MAG: hypothetical protein RMJ82_13550 [Gemmatales bacterium]|nr:hypothetical protein [Gemmatales bacterium]
MIARYEALARRESLTTPIAVPTWYDVPCPVCGNDQADTVLQAPSWHESEPRLYAVVQCRACATWYTNPLPQNHGQSPQGTNPGKPDPVHAHLADTLPRPSAAGNWLLHFGPLDMAWLTQVRPCGWQVLAWNERPSEIPAAWYDRGGLAVFGALDELAQSCRHQIAAITAYDWFERQESLRQILEHWHTLLHPNGWLLLAVPNLDSAGFLTFGSLWRGLDLPHRRVHFRAGTLSRCLVQTGWHIRRIRTLACAAWLRESAERIWHDYAPSRSGWHRLRLWWRTSWLSQALIVRTSPWFGRGDWLVVFAQPR